MAIVCNPNFGEPLPSDEFTPGPLPERVAAAAKTIDFLIDNGIDPEKLVESDSTADDDVLVASIVESFAADEAKTSASISTTKLSSLPAVVLLEVNSLLTEFGQSVVRNATQIRHLVTNKLILETANPDARVRLRALELLGKISDVGLFTERSEVTITHQSTDELKLSLREKLNRLRSKMEIVEDITPLPSPKTILENLDDELGLSEEMVPETAEEKELA
jgi:hypothetical protein